MQACLSFEAHRMEAAIFAKTRPTPRISGGRVEDAASLDACRLRAKGRRSTPPGFAGRRGQSQGLDEARLPQQSSRPRSIDGLRSSTELREQIGVQNSAGARSRRSMLGAEERQDARPT